MTLNHHILLIFTIIHFAQTHSQTQIFTFLCNSHQYPINIKPNRHSLIYTTNINTNIQIFHHHQIKCQITPNRTLCILDQIITDLNITCFSQSQITLKIQIPQIISSSNRINAEIIQIYYGSENQGILQVRVQNSLYEKIKQIPKDKKFNYSNLFIYSNCVKFIDLIEDNFKFFIIKNNQLCIIKSLFENLSWYYHKIERNITENNMTYNDFLKENQQNLLNINIKKKSTIKSLIQNDDINYVSNLSLYIQISKQKQQKQIYQIKNFVKGLQFFQFNIQISQDVKVIKIKSSINVYILFQILPFQNLIQIQVDQYIFTHLHHTFPLKLLLPSFNNNHNITIGLQQFLNTQKVYYVISQCNDNQCQNITDSKIVQHQYTPQCKKLFNQNCYLKIQLKIQKFTILGFLAYLAQTTEILQINKINKGILGRDLVKHFMIPKQILVLSPDIIEISINGAKAFLTYDINCKRIYCCQQQLYYGSSQISNKKSNLYIFLQGTDINYYTIIINTLQNKQFNIQNGLLLHSKMKPNQKQKYYIFHLNDSQNAIEINCNAPHGSLILFVNTQKNTFPTKKSYNFVSTDCYLKLSKNDKLKKIFITLLRANLLDQNVIQFGILGVTSNFPIIIPQNIPFYDIYYGNTYKKIKYKFSKSFLTQKSISFKVDVYNQKNIHSVQLILQNQKQKNFTYIKNISTSTIKLTQQILNQLCQNFQDSCTIIFYIHNTSPAKLDISFLIWVRSQAINILEGYFMNFQTGSLGSQSHFYINIQDKSKPLNVYIYSTDIQIETLYRVWPKITSQTKQKWPFPTFKNITKQMEDKFVYSYSSSIYYDPESLKKLLGDKSGILLITLRDKSIKKQKNSYQFYNKGGLQIVYTTGKVEMHENDKIEYELKKNEVLTIGYSIKKLLLQNSQNHEVYIHNTHMIGRAQISYAIQTNTIKKVQFNLNETQLVILNIDELKNKIGTIIQNQDVIIIFKIKCITQVGRFLTTIVTTNSDYRQLTLGVPQQFYINKNRSLIFQFINNMYTNLKIKINRKQGFPEYKILSCNPNQQQLFCIKQLQNLKGAIDPDILVLQGRSHQLQINRNSQHYCNGCRYYISLYSINQQISGSITVLGAGLSVLLIQGKAMTTKVYQKEIDSYRIKPVINKSTQIIITCHMGHIQALLVQNKKQIISKSTNSSSGMNINFKLDIKSNQQIFLNIKSSQNQNSLYTVLFKTDLKSIMISDGMPLRFQNIQKSKLIFQYICDYDATLIIISNSTLKTSLTCSNNSKIKNQTFKTQLRQNLISNKSTIQLNQNICSIYHIQIQNQQPIDLTILVNGLDMILLPFNTVLNSRVSKLKNQIYQIPIQQKMIIKILIKMCESGSALIGIAESKQQLRKREYGSEFQIFDDETQYAFEHIGKPGILYLIMESRLKTLQYSIQVFPFYSISQIKNITVMIEELFISPRYLKTDLNGYHQYQLKFQKIKIINEDNQTQYNINYIAIQSNKRNLIKKQIRCNGQYMALDISPLDIINHYRITPTQESTSTISFIFQTNLPLSYLTIIPIIDPKLPPYISQCMYQIIQISNGIGPHLIQKLIVRLVVFIENITKIQDQKTINLLLFLTVFTINLCILLVVCLVCANKCRREIQIQRKPLPTFEKSQLGPQNSLQMIQNNNQQQNEKKQQIDKIMKK